MKTLEWKNKGHELDEEGSIFEKNMKVWIYGAGDAGQDLYIRMKFLNCIEGFIDNNSKWENGERYLNLPVVSYTEYASKEHINTIVVIAANAINSQWFISQMLNIGYKEGENLFLYTSFRRYWLPIFAMYSYGKICVNGLSLITNTNCNLKCKKCLNFTTLNKKHKVIDFQSIKETIDLTFNALDFAEVIGINGGESFLLMDHLLAVLEYIGENYRNQIGYLFVTTNGTIMPSDELCKMIKKYDAILQVDDYRETVKETKLLVDEIEEKIKDEKLNYIITKADNWTDLGYGIEHKFSHNVAEMKNYYVACQSEWIEMYEGKLSNCNYYSFAVRAGLEEENPEVIYDLRKYTDEKKMELFEYTRRFTPRGYLPMCTRCAGYLGVNTSKVPVAEQE